MSLLAIALLVMVVLLILLNTKRWRALTRGTRMLKRGFQEELRGDEDER